MNKCNYLLGMYRNTYFRNCNIQTEPKIGLYSY